jgi:hypothetical protein
MFALRRFMSASLIGRLGSSAFQTIHLYSVDVAHGFLHFLNDPDRVIPKAIAIDNDLRGTLRNFGLKVGMTGAVKFEGA